MSWNSRTEASVDHDREELQKKLAMSVNEIELSVRAANCLNNANITTVGRAGPEDRSGYAEIPQFRQRSR